MNRASFDRCFALIHTSRQLRLEALPEFLAKHRLIIHPGPASSLTYFTDFFYSWLPHISWLCIADAEAFLDTSAQREPNCLRQLLSSISRQNGGSLRALSVSLSRTDWNNLAGWNGNDVMSLWLFREVLDIRDLERFEVCKPPERKDRPRWGRKPSWDAVARRMGEKKWKEVEDSIASIVTQCESRA